MLSSAGPLVLEPFACEQRKVYAQLKAMKTFKPDESITVQVHEEFELCLPVLASAGYEWQVSEQTSGLAVLGSSFRAPANSQVGGASQQILRLRADQVGTHSLPLVSKRPWDSTPSKTHSVRITVQDRK